MTRPPPAANRDESPLEPRVGILVVLCVIVLLCRAADRLNASRFVGIPDSPRAECGSGSPRPVTATRRPGGVT